MQVTQNRSRRVVVAVVDEIATPLQAGSTRIEGGPAVRRLHVVDQGHLLARHECGVEFCKRPAGCGRHYRIGGRMKDPDARGLELRDRRELACRSRFPCKPYERLDREIVRGHAPGQRDLHVALRAVVRARGDDTDTADPVRKRHMRLYRHETAGGDTRHADTAL